MSSTRESLDRHYLRIVQLTALRSTCPRRRVGAIITDARGVVLGTGFNGVPRGFPHCTDTPCDGANDVAGDTSRCLAVHAEKNAIIFCHDVDRAHVMYVSCFPCFDCAKMIANTNIKRVVACEEYADVRGRDLLEKAGVSCVMEVSPL